MALFSQCQVETSEVERSFVHWEALRPCLIQDGEPCSVCKEDMELERKFQDSELQEKHRSLRTRMNTNHDPFILKFPPELASYIFSLCLEVEAHKIYLRELPTPFCLATVCQGWRQLAGHGQLPSCGQQSHSLLQSHRSWAFALDSRPSATGYNYQAAYH